MKLYKAVKVDTPKGVRYAVKVKNHLFAKWEDESSKLYTQKQLKTMWG